MRGRRQIWLLFLSLAFPLSIFSQVTSGEPQYEGKSLNFWLARMLYPPTRAEASNAICHMEPSAVHELAKLVAAPPSTIRSAAVQALIALGPAGKAAIPDLAKLLADPESHEADSVILILSKMGPDGAPALIDALKRTKLPGDSAPMYEQMRSEFVRERLEIAISRCGVAGRPALPIFLGDLQSTNQRIRNTAVLALSGLASEPDVVKVLLNCLHDPDETTRVNAARGLARTSETHSMLVTPDDFDPMTNALRLPPANPVVTDGLFNMAEFDTEFRCREMATVSLMRVDPKNTLDRFVAGLDSTNATERRHAAWNLNYFKKGARSAIQPLIKRLSDTDAEVRGNAAVALREIGEEPDVVVPALMKNLSDPEQKNREITAIALGAFGKAAKPAVSNIVDIINKATNDLDSEGLIGALDKIDSSAAEKAEQDYNRKHPDPDAEPPVPFGPPTELR